MVVMGLLVGQRDPREMDPKIGAKVLGSPELENMPIQV